MNVIEKKGITSNIIIKDNIVIKTVAYKNYDKELLDREEYWLKIFKKYNISPRFIERKENSIIMSYCGELATVEDFQKQEIQIQLINILQILIKNYCFYNDFKLNNFTVQKGKLYIIDFGWCSKIIEDYTCGGKIKSDFIKKPSENIFSLFKCIKMKDNVFLCKESYFDLTNKLKEENPKHWSSGNRRWEYHEKTVELLKQLDTTSVLEAGTMGIKILYTSDTIDYDIPQGGWKLSYKPTYNHNLKVLPWPVNDKQYDVFIALRVFHHFRGDPKIYFNEMARITNHIILAFPHSIANIYKEMQKPDYEYVCERIDTTILYWNIKSK